jgi:hypothetical protein
MMGQRLENGYELKTTFWSDFTIADAFASHGDSTWGMRDQFKFTRKICKYE